MAKDQKRVRTLSLKKNEEEEVYDFVEKQTNLSDTLLYLIQKEIAENGVRDLQMHIPAKRNIESIKELLNIKTDNNSNVVQKEPKTTKEIEIQDEHIKPKEIEKIEIDEELLNSF